MLANWDASTPIDVDAKDITVAAITSTPPCRRRVVRKRPPLPFVPRADADDLTTLTADYPSSSTDVATDNVDAGDAKVAADDALVTGDLKDSLTATVVIYYGIFRRPSVVPHFIEQDAIVGMIMKTLLSSVVVEDDFAHDVIVDLLEKL
ncbi:hypothetical protein ACLOJK_013072 [Asimina triloba]